MRPSDRSYLLRVWRDGRGADAWRASLRELRSGDVRHFPSIEALLAFLQRSPGTIVAREDVTSDAADGASDDPPDAR